MITQAMRDHKVNVRYKVDNLDILFSDGSTEKIQPGMVTHLYIEKDYDHLYFPIMNISVVMDDMVYNRIHGENETVKFRLRINRILYDTNNKYLKYEEYCNDTFICFLNKEVIVKDKESVEDKKNTERSQNTQNTRSNTRNFYLFKDDVIKCKKTLNLSVSSSSLPDLVIYMFNTIGVQKLLMSKPNNLSNISNILIPTGNVIECIRYLDEVKGFFNKGLVLFFDIDTAYFIDNSSRCSAWRKNEVRMTHMHISNQKNVDSQLTGVYIDNDRKSAHIFANTERVKITNSNLLNDQLNGNNITIINNKSNKITTVNEKTTQIGNSNKIVLEAKENNNYTIEAMKYRMKENECNLEIAFIGIDLNTLNPNKEFLLTYDDSTLNKKYGGNYRISKFTAALKKDGEELVGEVDCLFKKQD